MEFLILVVMFLVALGLEKEPQGENVYVARRPVRKAGTGYGKRADCGHYVRRKRVYKGA